MTSPIVNLIKCEVCGLVLYDWHSYRNHVLNDHGVSLKAENYLVPVECEYCGTEMWAICWRHETDSDLPIPPGNIAPFNCLECGSLGHISGYAGIVDLWKASSIQPPSLGRPISVILIMAAVIFALVASRK